MNANELRPLLVEYRNQVEQAWTPETAHPGYEGRRGDPTGQCGVTSAWLRQRLREDHDIRRSFFCVGSVWINSSWSRPHCWVELGATGSHIIADLTGSQLGDQIPEIVCDTYLDLWERDRVLYSCLESRSAAITPEDAGLRRRLSVLSKAVTV